MRLKNIKALVIYTIIGIVALGTFAHASTITTILGTDTLSDSRAVINTNFSNLNTDKLESGDSPSFTDLTVTNATSTGTLSLSTLTNGSILFATTSGQISQNNSNFFWKDADNSLIIGDDDDNTSTINGVTKTQSFTVHNQGGGNAYDLAFHRHSNTSGTFLAGFRSRGSESSPSIVADGDNLLDVFGIGYDGTDYEFATSIMFDVDGTPGDNDMPGRIVFLTTPDGDTSLVERMRISQDGNVGIGTTSPYAKLSVVGQTVSEYFTATSTTATSTFTGIQWDYSTSTAQDLSLSRIGESTFSTVQDLQNIFHSAGFVSGGAIADIGGEAVSVALGTGLVRTSNSATALTQYFDWVASTTIDVPTDGVRYIGVEYNSGSPRVASRTTYNWNLKTDFPIGNVVNDGGTLHLENAPQAVGDHAANMIERIFETLGRQRDNKAGGLVIGETGSRNVTLSAGTLWERISTFPISAIDTSGADTFDTYCGTTKNETATSTWDNLNFCDGGSLTGLANNRWAVLWFYIELDGNLIMQYGTAQYVSEAGAEAEGVPSTISNRTLVQSELMGRFIFQESASTAESIETIHGTAFPGALVTDHSNLSTLAWTSAGHTGTANTVPYFGSDGSAQEYSTSTTAFTDKENSFTVGTTTVVNLDVTTAINFMGEYFTNFTTYVRSIIASASLVVTGAWDFGGATSLEIPNNGTVNANGEITTDDTSGQLRYFAGGEERVIEPAIYASFSLSTTTAWNGTTTRALGPAFEAQTWSAVKCFTDAGTLDVFFSDGTNEMDKLNASTTVGTFSFSTNNTFTASEKRFVDIGNPASSPTEISCTVEKLPTAN